VLYDGVHHTAMGSLSDDVLTLTFIRSPRATVPAATLRLAGGVGRQEPAKTTSRASTCCPRCACAPTCRGNGHPNRAGRYQTINDLICEADACAASAIWPMN